MNFSATRIPYNQTGFFSKIILDYLAENSTLRPFYEFPVSAEGIRSAIDNRKKFPQDRKMLVEELRRQYEAIGMSEAVAANLKQLLDENCFTITTAHQPAIFTGTLYFIYKILHAIKLSETLNKSISSARFVPVYYMGSEDADLDELGKIELGGEMITWNTRQKGAVGRMKTDGLDAIIDRLEGAYSMLEHGKELIGLLRSCYKPGDSIQESTFKLVHFLFAEYGLLVVIPDNARFKRSVLPVFEDDLFKEQPAALVSDTLSRFPSQYKVQANPRPINLFYLSNDIRSRIERQGDHFRVLDTGISFTADELRKELHEHPENFSPNVILRGLLQSTILPDIAFIGGGGEMAYWLELRHLFNAYKVPFPVLVLRNSFLIVDGDWSGKMEKNELNVHDIFKPAEDIINELVRRASASRLNLEPELIKARRFYEELKLMAEGVDHSLARHIEALQAKAIKPLKELEKKFLRKEKRKYEDQSRQIRNIRNALFPADNLQERVQNFMPYYARWGKDFIELLYQHSLSLEQQFVVLRHNSTRL